MGPLAVDVFGPKEVIWGPSLVMFLDERRSFGARVGDAFGPKEVIWGPTLVTFWDQLRPRVGGVFGPQEVNWGPSLVFFLDKRRSFGARIGDPFGPKIGAPCWRCFLTNDAYV